ncbi:enediyne antibiotic chromoprotein [Micromonospora sp. NPDC050417]|uniref:enediyne antibiotic chromoprotein n=1 Tax=Micromonospora sp. NPDC050417 TaxID=3364280 RepID=UPI00379288E6
MLRAAVAASIASLSLLVPSTAHASEAPPQLAVSPATALTDGQTVELDLANFTAGHTVFLVQCGYTGPVCDIGAAALATVDENGNATSTFTVRREFTGLAPDQTPASVNCAVTECGIVAIDESDPTIGAEAVISFAS